MGQYAPHIALFRPMGSIRAFGRPISPYGLNTAFGRPISPNGLNTGSGYAIAPNGAIRSAFLPGVALRFFTRGCATLHPGLYSGAPSGRLRQARAQFITSAVGRCSFPLACHKRPRRGRLPPSPNQSRPHRGRPFPLAIYGEGVADSPGVRSKSIPPSPNTLRPRRGRQFPLAIYGEGVADRPGVRSNRPRERSRHQGSGLSKSNKISQS